MDNIVILKLLSDVLYHKRELIAKNREHTDKGNKYFEFLDGKYQGIEDSKKIIDDVIEGLSREGDWG